MNKPKDYADRSGLLKNAYAPDTQPLSLWEKAVIYAFLGVICFWVGFWIGHGVAS